jgi:hypothetical protein
LVELTVSVRITGGGDVDRRHGMIGIHSEEVVAVKLKSTPSRCHF